MNDLKFITAGDYMNNRIQELEKQCWSHRVNGSLVDGQLHFDTKKFAELIVRECVNREELLGAIARGWCSEKNSHKIMDSDLALAIFDQVEQQIKQHFGVEEFSVDEQLRNRSTYFGNDI